MSRLLTGPLVLAALLTVATSAAPVPKSRPTDFHFPTTVGARWVYTYSQNDRDWEWIEVITGAVEKDGGKIVSIGLEFDGKLSPYQKVQVSRTGLALLQWDDGFRYSPPWLVLKLPARSGDRWEFKTQTPSSPMATWESEWFEGTMTVGKPERVEVPAGVYWALPVVCNVSKGNVRGITTTWYASGVGIVKREISESWDMPGVGAVRPGPDTRIEVLKSFDPGPSKD